MSKEIVTTEDQQTPCSSPCSTSAVPREVIENQLLVALDDKSKVAILADEELLTFLITAAQDCEVWYEHREYKKQVIADFRHLRLAAFGK